MFPTLQLSNTIVLNSYGICIGVGGLFGYMFLFFNSKNAGLNRDDLPLVYIISLVSAFLGGKLFYFFENPQIYLNNPNEIFFNLSNGFVIYGGIFFSAFFLYGFLKLRNLNILNSFDYLTLTCLIIQFFGKIGCLLAGCCYGLETNTILSIKYYNKKNIPTPLNVNLHPTQIYEALIVAIIFFYLNSRIKKEHKKGLVFFEYICFYSFFRFFTEFLRGDLSRGFVLNGMLSHAQFIAIILCSIFGFLIFKINRSNLL